MEVVRRVVAEHLGLKRNESLSRTEFYMWATMSGFDYFCGLRGTGAGPGAVDDAFRSFFAAGRRMPDGVAPTLADIKYLLRKALNQRGRALNDDGSEDGDDSSSSGDDSDDDALLKAAKPATVSAARAASAARGQACAKDIDRFIDTTAADYLAAYNIFLHQYVAVPRVEQDELDNITLDLSNITAERFYEAAAWLPRPAVSQQQPLQCIFDKNNNMQLHLNRYCTQIDLDPETLQCLVTKVGAPSKAAHEATTTLNVNRALAIHVLNHAAKYLSGATAEERKNPCYQLQHMRGIIEIRANSSSNNDDEAGEIIFLHDGIRIAFETLPQYTAQVLREIKDRAAASRPTVRKLREAGDIAKLETFREKKRKLDAAYTERVKADPVRLKAKQQTARARYDKIMAEETAEERAQRLAKKAAGVRKKRAADNAAGKSRFENETAEAKTKRLAKAAERMRKRRAAAAKVAPKKVAAKAAPKAAALRRQRVDEDEDDDEEEDDFAQNRARAAAAPAPKRGRAKKQPQQKRAAPAAKPAGKKRPPKK